MRSMDTMKEQLRGWTFPVAAITLVLCWLLFFLLLHNPVSPGLFVLGNIAAAMGVLLILLAMKDLRRRGEPEQARDFTTTTEIVKQGIYSVVRHPLYLGWLLAYLAAMLVSQHWLIAALGVIGMATMVQIARDADGQLVAKFGPEYESYMEEVPRLNIVLGIARKLKREG
jgi:protein-S-isoprenylcysteine O-methyltransferase Ste14